jgi:hypothetical protein
MPDVAEGEVATIRPDIRKSSVMRSVNDDLCALSIGLGCTEPIAFFCECRVPTCFAPLWHTIADYQAVVAEGADWLLVDGHVATMPFPERDASVAAGAVADELSARRARRLRQASRPPRLRVVGEDTPSRLPPSAA